MKIKKLSLLTSLKTRFMLVFALFSVLLALFYSFLLMGFSLGTEDEIFNRQLALEVEHQQAFYAEHQHFDNPPRDMELYSAVDIRNHPLYNRIAELESAASDAVIDELEEHDLHIAKATIRESNLPFYILYSVATQEIDEERTRQFNEIGLMAFLIVASTGILVGAWLGARTTRPIIQLDQRVQQLERQGEFGETRSFGADEVGRLALSFATSYERTQQFLAREKRFTREVSHELRTPVAVIQGALDILELQPDNQRALGRIRRASHEIERLIETFLLLGREENLTLSEEQLDARAVCELIIEEHRKESPVPIHFNLLEDPQLNVLPPVFGVLLGNLLSNAVRHTREGEIRVRLSRAALAIEDSGDGFPPEILEAVGHPYINGSSGCGLGLSIVQRICKQFGWTLRVDSTPGEGSSVQISFNPAAPTG